MVFGKTIKIACRCLRDEWYAFILPDSHQLETSFFYIKLSCFVKTEWKSKQLYLPQVLDTFHSSQWYQISMMCLGKKKKNRTLWGPWINPQNLGEKRHDKRRIWHRRERIRKKVLRHGRDCLFTALHEE